MPILKKYNRDFFKKWNHDMSYILGFLFADGNIIKTKRGTHFVSFYSADKKLLIDFKKIMELDHKISKRSVRSGEVYRIQLGSREMYADLYRLGMVPKKADRMKMIDVPEKYLGDFVRGYFDGDGNVWTGYSNKMRKVGTQVMHVAFTSASTGFLRGLFARLKISAGIKGGGVYAVKDKNCARLSFATLDSLKLYRIMYNASCSLFLHRKRQVFENFIKMRP